MTKWQTKSFTELSVDELYDILKLRIDVFVVEQCCFYPDIDDLDRDKQTKHLFSYKDGKIAAYLRVLAKGISYDDYISIGRVIVAPEARGTGLGDVLIQQGLKICKQDFPGQALKISAQQHLEKFYNKHGFIAISEMYLEDNIPHISMKYSPIN